MQPMTLGQVAQAAQGQRVHAAARMPVTGLAIDSRQVKPGDLFVALSGEHTDGHAFIGAALAAGASACLCRRVAPGCPSIRVANPRRALGRIAAAYRRRFPRLRVAAVTGSSGKTSTKEMLATILGARAATLESQGNFNNDLGLPLSLAQLRPEHRFAVLELGMNAPGEIRRLARMAQPQVGVITNIGEAHLGRFKDQRALAQAKLELLAELPANGIAVVNADDPYLAGWRPRARRVTFGQALGADIRLVKASLTAQGTRVELADQGRLSRFTLRVLGVHQAMNAAAAVAAAVALGTGFSEACHALRGFKPRAAMRMEVLRIGPHRVINDAYNSNPQSAAAALRTFIAWPVPGPRTVVLGSMLELGSRSASAHRDLGRQAAQAGVHGLIAVGAEAAPAAAVALRAGVKWAAACDRAEEAWPLLSRHLSPRGSVVLVKGSRGVGLEKMIALFQQQRKK